MKLKYNLRKYDKIIKPTMENTQITPISGYDPQSRIIFSEPVSGAIPDSKPKIEFKRINISTKNEDGSVGELIFPTGRLFSFGVSENTSQETGSVNGYTFPICLHNRDGATEEEKEWTNMFDAVVERCVDHLVENKEEIEQYDLTRADLTKSKGGLNPLYWKREKYTNAKGKTEMRVVPGTGPTLYTKLIFSKKHNKFLSQFFDVNDEPLNALDLMGKYCYTNAAVKIESIFIGSKISLQVKLYEAVIEPTSSGMKRLLARPKVTQSRVLEHQNNGGVMAPPMDLDDDDDAGSLIDDKEEGDKEDEIGGAVTVPPSKAPVKRVIKKVTRKPS